MSPRLRLARSIPFWILVLGSLAAAVAGTLMVIDKTSTMTTTITNGSATGVEVYAGQAWVTFGAALVGAGLIGLVATLALTVAASLIPAPAAEPISWTDADDAELETTPNDEVVELDAPSTEPAPIAEDADAATEQATSPEPSRL